MFLYHACQLSDFASYLSLGGIPSRALLETNGLPFTPFKTDTIDQENGVWDKVFINLSDFGHFFASDDTYLKTTFARNATRYLLLRKTCENWEIADISQGVCKEIVCNPTPIPPNSY